MRRRGAGIGAIQKDKLAAERYKDKGNELAETSFQEMTKQMENFRSNLEEFAREHREEIKKDPNFRRHFQEMCATIGVDPLASSKGFWSEMLGFGDFYYELAVQIIEVCMAATHRTGGLMEVGELRQRLIRSRGGGRKKGQVQQEISIDDILRAIKKIKVLGNGFSVIPLGSNRYLVQSVPGELSMDQTLVLQKAESNKGLISCSFLRNQVGWDNARAQQALDRLLTDGLAWVDLQDESREPTYWIPSIYTSFLPSSQADGPSSQ